MKRAEFNTRHGGYYFGCNFLLKALNVKMQCVCDKFEYSSISREIFSAILFVLSSSGYRQKDAASCELLFCPYFTAQLSTFATEPSLPLSTTIFMMASLMQIIRIANHF